MVICPPHVLTIYGELLPTNGWDRFRSLGHPSKFQRVSRLVFVTAATSLTGGQSNFARCLAVSWAGTLYIHFWGLLPPDGILPRAIFTYVQVLHSPVLAALLHGTPAAGVSQTLRHGTRNGITKLSQRAPPIFGRAAITLDIDPHCSCSSVLCMFRKQKMTVLADSKVSDVKVTWWFWNKRTSMSLYVSLYTSALEVEGMLKRLQLRLGWVTAI